MDAPAETLGVEGAGMKLAEGMVFHPRLELSTGYQTNVFHQDSGDAGAWVGAALARIGVGAGIASTPLQRIRELSPGAEPPARRLAFDADLELTWNQYLSGDAAASTQSDLGVGAMLDLQFFPDGPMTFELRDGFTRAVVPPQAYTGDNVDRDKNEALAGLTFKPGGGALQGYLTYQFTIDLFERGDLAFANRTAHTFTLGSKYQWLPKTQFSLQARYGFVAPSSAIAGYKSGGTPLQVWVGASTLITHRVGVVLRGGYANGFYDAGPSYSTYLAMVEGRLALGPTLRVAFGYSHDLEDSVLANYYEDHKFYARLRGQFAGRVEAKASAAVMLRAYAYGGAGPVMIGDATFCNGPRPTCSSSNRGDLVLKLDGSLEYQANAWLSLGGTYSLVADATDAYIMSDGAFDSSAYVAHELMATGTARF